MEHTGYRMPEVAVGPIFYGNGVCELVITVERRGRTLAWEINTFSALAAYLVRDLPEFPISEEFMNGYQGRKIRVFCENDDFLRAADAVGEIIRRV